MGHGRQELVPVVADFVRVVKCTGTCRWFGFDLFCQKKGKKQIRRQM